MSRRICIVSGFQIIGNPRVVKEADALAELGYDVTVLGAINRVSDVSRIIEMLDGRRWRHWPVVDVSNSRAGVRLQNVALRGAARLARFLVCQFGIEHSLQLGFETIPLLRAARQIDADLYSLHLEKALWVGTRLVAEHRVVRIDIEDWYSKDGLKEDRAARPLRLMRAAEDLLLNRAVHATATSHAMADALVSSYGCPRPAVVYNSFPISERERIDGCKLDRRDSAIPSIVWFSQTIGPGRGLEALVSAFSTLSRPAELHLRGTARAGYIDRLLEGMPRSVRERIFIHPQVRQEELLSRLAEHDIGYCGELSDCASRDVTITNKVFEFMRARVAIVASDTKGQSEVARVAPEAVRLFKQGDADSLREALEKFVVDPDVLSAAKQASLEALTTHFSWEQSRRRIQEQVSRYFGDSMPAGQ